MYYRVLRRNCCVSVSAISAHPKRPLIRPTTSCSCVECAPEPFSEAIGDSAREWLESALDICIDTGKEMECVDASSLSTEVPQEGSPDDDAKNEDVTGDAHQSKGKSSESEKSTSSVAPSSTEGSTDSITSSASSTITIGGENSTMSNGSARETPLPASEDEESNTVEMPFGSASSLVFDIQFLFLQAVLASFSLFMICLR